MRTFKEYQKIYETRKYQQMKNNVDEYLDTEIENQLLQGLNPVYIQLNNIAQHINLDNKVQLFHLIDDVLDHTDIPYSIVDNNVIIQIGNNSDEAELDYSNKTTEESKLEPWKQIVQQFKQTDMYRYKDDNK